MKRRLTERWIGYPVFDSDKFKSLPTLRDAWWDTGRGLLEGDVFFIFKSMSLRMFYIGFSKDIVIDDPAKSILAVFRVKKLKK